MPKSPQPLTVTSKVATARSPLTPTETHAAVLALDTPTMFTKWAVIPAVVGIDLLGLNPWGIVGAKRRLRLGNNGSMLETVIHNQVGTGFTYHITDAYKSIEPYADLVEDDWAFADDGKGGTHVTWTWTFHSNARQQLYGKLFMHRLWAVYMQRILPPAMARLKVPVAEVIAHPVMPQTYVHLTNMFR